MAWYNPMTWFDDAARKAQAFAGPAGAGKWMLWELRKAEESRKFLLEERNKRLEAGIRPDTLEEYKRLWREGKIDRKHDILDTVDTWNTILPGEHPPALEDEKIEMWYRESYAFEIAYWKNYDEEHAAEVARIKEQFGMDYDEYLKQAEEGHNIVNDKKKWSKGWR